MKLEARQECGQVQEAIQTLRQEREVEMNRIRLENMRLQHELEGRRTLAALPGWGWFEVGTQELR